MQPIHQKHIMDNRLMLLVCVISLNHQNSGNNEHLMHVHKRMSDHQIAKIR